MGYPPPVLAGLLRACVRNSEEHTESAAFRDSSRDARDLSGNMPILIQEDGGEGWGLQKNQNLAILCTLPLSCPPSTLPLVFVIS